MADLLSALDTAYYARKAYANTEDKQQTTQQSTQGTQETDKPTASKDQIQANYEKYKHLFKDANEELVSSETFLNLLVAEMTNQDPMEPTTNTEFVTQMAQFTQLQYAKDSSKYALANYASSLVGKVATGSRMEGKELVVQTGVVEKVTNTKDKFTVYINGTAFELDEINSVSSDASGDIGIGGSVSNSLGDRIARASAMIGMYATVQPDDSGVLVNGFITSIQVKDGAINAVVNGVPYNLETIKEVTYAQEVPNTPPQNEEENNTQTEEENNVQAEQQTQAMAYSLRNDMQGTSETVSEIESAVQSEYVERSTEMLAADIVLDSDEEDLEEIY